VGSPRGGGYLAGFAESRRVFFPSQAAIAGRYSPRSDCFLPKGAEFTSIAPLRNPSGDSTLPGHANLSALATGHIRRRRPVGGASRGAGQEKLGGRRPGVKGARQGTSRINSCLDRGRGVTHTGRQLCLWPGDGRNSAATGLRAKVDSHFWDRLAPRSLVSVIDGGGGGRCAGGRSRRASHQRGHRESFNPSASAMWLAPGPTQC